MQINFALPSLMLLTFVANYSCASVLICFVRNGLNVNRTFDSGIVTYAAARESLELTEDDIFIYRNRALDREGELETLVSDKKCNRIISQSAKSSIEVCIVNDQCKTFDLENNAKVKTVRDKLLASLPEYYRDEKCAHIVFLNDKRQVIQIEDEREVPHRDIVKNGRIEAYNKFIDNTTELDITWLLYNHRVKVNMLMSLSSLRYWITKPNACPNLKSKLNLPDKALFPNAIDDLAQNWLIRDKRARLDQVASRKVESTQLVAPYAHETFLPIEFHAYKTEKSEIPRLFYVNVNEKDKVAFTGSRTDEFQDNHLTLKISSRSPEDKILLLKDVRSTNNRAEFWTNVVIASNNAAVTLLVTWNNHKPGFAYYCELFDFRANHERHYLYGYVSRNGVCDFRYIDENKIHYDLLFNKEELIENGQDLSKFRYELGVVMLPYRPGKLSCQRGKRDTQYIANTDIHHDQITMGGGGKGNNTGHQFPKEGCASSDGGYPEENKRSLYFNVFIFKSQEIAEKIIEDVATF